MRNPRSCFSLILLLLVLTAALAAYEWSPYGPSNVETCNFACVGGGVVHEIICEANGILIYGDNGWEEYSNGELPVWDVEMIIAATADLLVVMGDGSYSDGIYAFNFSNHQFNVLQWTINPRFINYCPADSSFYAGGQEGLFKSSDGLNWQSVGYFQNIFCHDMAIYENFYVVACEGNIHYSPDAGNNWFASSTMQFISDLAVTSDGVFYGVFPDESWSSGLYSSHDHGENWQVEFWSCNLTSTGFDTFGNLFVSWEQPQPGNQGVAIWQTDIQELIFMNDGLPCLYINKLSWHPLIDCNNIIACSDEGLYMLTSYTVESSPHILPAANLNISNFPNPFNPSTTICFDLELSSQVNINIYNAKGQMIDTLFQGGMEAGKQYLYWDSATYSPNLPSGNYYFNIKTAHHQDVHKVMLLK